VFLFIILLPLRLLWFIVFTVTTIYNRGFMKKQNTLAFLVRNLDSWPTKIKSAPVVDGYRWVKNNLGELFLFDQHSFSGIAENLQITLHDWKVACLDSAAERTKESTVQISNFDMNTKHIPAVKLTSHEKAVIADAWDTNKNIPDYKPLGESNTKTVDANLNKQKIYIAGPMTGYDQFNRSAFNRTSDALSLAGYIVLNPAILPDGLTQAQYMQIDLTMLQCCDAIFMLKGWDDSAGAMAEHALAMKLGLTVIHEVDLC
tara:strand:- start:744 stop:1520 length:777 start_codon:yes stop_codon:yes gene_type:complete